MDKTLETAKRMFRHACAFEDCAVGCEREPNHIVHRTHSHMVAGIVNSAFACEVFIKALLAFHGRSLEELKGHKHNLKDLWKAYKAVNPTMAESVEAGMKNIFNSSEESMFDRLLEDVSNAFEYWRYIYEKQEGNINVNFLSYFRIMLRNVCCEQIYGQTWEEYIEQNN